MEEIYILEMGELWDIATTVRVFASLEKALANIPPEFTEIPNAHSIVGVCHWYGESQEDEKGRAYWLSIKSFDIED